MHWLLFGALGASLTIRCQSHNGWEQEGRDEQVKAHQRLSGSGDAVLVTPTTLSDLILL